MKKTNISSNCEISKTSIIFDNVEIEDNVKISDYCLIASSLLISLVKISIK